MKVREKQRNSKMCVICGLDNPFGLRAPFYSMEDGSVMSAFRFREEHQSYPGRVHGGLITAMLDEMGLRALWAYEGGEYTYGVTISLETKYRKPIGYDVPLYGRGVIVKATDHFVTAECFILDENGATLASATVKYLRLTPEQIRPGVDDHEEMCYLIEDGTTELLGGIL